MRKLFLQLLFGIAVTTAPTRASLVALTSWIEGQNGSAVKSGSDLAVEFHSGATISWDTTDDLLYLTGPADTDLGRFSCLWIRPTAVDRDFTITISGLEAYPYHTAILDLGSRLVGGKYEFSSVRLLADGGQSAARQASGWAGSPVLIQSNDRFFEDLTFRNSVGGVNSGAVVTTNSTISSSEVKFQVHQVAGDGLGLSFGSYLSPIAVPEPSILAFLGFPALLWGFQRSRK